MRQLQLLPFIIVLLAFAGCKQEDEALPKYELIWTESFNGSSLDTDKWEIMVGNGTTPVDYGVWEWGNSEMQYYTDRTDNVKVEDGKLKLTARYEPDYNGTGYDYTSGRIRTRPDLNVTWRYGKFEALIKLPSAQSVWPAFWMLPKLGSWPYDGEIDIMEAKHEDPIDWAGTIHFQNSDCNCHNHKGASANSFGNLSTQFVKYAVEWEEDEIRWYVNDREQGKVTRSSTPGWPFDGVKPFYLLLNVAVGGPSTGYTGGTWPNPAHYPTTMEVEYVKVYKKAY